MERASQIFFWVSIAIISIGFFDRLTPNGLLQGVAPGSYWKAGIAFIGFSLAAGQLAMLRRST